jgi:hypothetical protein
MPGLQLLIRDSPEVCAAMRTPIELHKRDVKRLNICAVALKPSSKGARL